LLPPPPPREDERARSQALAALASEAKSSEAAIGLTEEEAALLEALRSSVRRASASEPQPLRPLDRPFSSQNQTTPALSDVERTTYVRENDIVE